MTGIAIYEPERGQISTRSFPVSKPKIGKRGQELTTREQDIRILYQRLVEYWHLYDHIHVIYNDMFSPNAATIKSLYKLIGIIELVFGKENITVCKEGEVRRTMLGTVKRGSGRQRDANKIASMKYYEQEVGSKPKNDDEADAYLLLRYFLKKHTQE